jgi:hypothetical protein
MEASTEGVAGGEKGQAETVAQEYQFEPEVGVAKA